MTDPAPMTVSQIRDKREFWRQFTYYLFINLTLWISWLIAGLRDDWDAPWALVPTAIGGVYLAYRLYRLGGLQAMRRSTIESEVADLRNRAERADGQGPQRPPITQIEFGHDASYHQLPPFHLQDVIDAREQRRQEQAETDPSLV